MSALVANCPACGGRAGRDGEIAYGLMLSSPKDIETEPGWRIHHCVPATSSNADKEPVVTHIVAVLGVQEVNRTASETTPVGARITTHVAMSDTHTVVARVLVRRA